MPNARLTGWRAYPNAWVTAASVTSAYAIEILTLQSDQPFWAPWTLDGFNSDFAQLVRVVTTANLGRQGDGFLHLRWHFDYMTFGMFSYWNTRYLPGLSYLSSPQHNQITIMDYDSNQTAIFIQAFIYLPAKLTPWHGGYKDVDYQFELGSLTS